MAKNQKAIVKLIVQTQNRLSNYNTSRGDLIAGKTGAEESYDVSEYCEGLEAIHFDLQKVVNNLLRLLPKGEHQKGYHPKLCKYVPETPIINKILIIKILCF